MWAKCFVVFSRYLDLIVFETIKKTYNIGELSSLCLISFRHIRVLEYKLEYWSTEPSRICIRVEQNFFSVPRRCRSETLIDSIFYSSWSLHWQFPVQKILAVLYSILKRRQKTPKKWSLMTFTWLKKNLSLLIQCWTCRWTRRSPASPPPPHIRLWWRRSPLDSPSPRQDTTKDLHIYLEYRTEKDAYSVLYSYILSTCMETWYVDFKILTRSIVADLFLAFHTG